MNKFGLTTEETYFVTKGTSFKKAGGSQHAQLCNIIISTPNIYLGTTYSWGDTYINNCSNLQVGGGNLCTWRKVGTNHHITLVVNQLANLL